MRKPTRVAIALGSNLGDRLALLRLAVYKLQHLALPDEPFLASRIYETAPVDCPPDAEPFLNAVVEFSTSETPERLLARLQGIERFLGRHPVREKNAPRTIDLDVLYHGEAVVESDTLSLPHPRWKERPFVLAPLADVAPERVTSPQNLPSLPDALIAPAEARQFQASLIRAKKNTSLLTALTAYDYPSARLLDESEVDIILVGDSLGMVVLGYSDTTHVTLDDIVHHLKAARRAVARAMLVADLPYETYQTPETALANARTLIDAGADVVKLEGGLEAQIAAITQAGIPVMAHIGMLPQNVLKEGGYKIKGRTEEGLERLLADARTVERAGAFSVVMEIVDAAAAERVTRKIGIPTIGIGSGEKCDGQILVTHDLVGFYPWFTPRFAKPEGNISQGFREAVDAFVRRTSDKQQINSEKIRMRDGDAILVMVKGGRVIHYAWNMSLPHVEFVRRTTGSLPEGAWVGTVSKLDGEVMGITSKYFYDYQLPAPEDVHRAIQDRFE